MAAKRLQSEITKCIREHFGSESMEAVIPLLESEVGYKRRLTEEIGTSVNKMMDTLSRRGDIKVYEADYSVLINILKLADESNCVRDVEQLILKYNKEKEAALDQTISAKQESSITHHSNSYKPGVEREIPSYRIETVCPDSFPSPRNFPRSFSTSSNAYLAPGKRSSSSSSNELLSPEEKRTHFSREHSNSLDSFGSPTLGENGVPIRYYLSEKKLQYDVSEHQKGLVAIINNFTKKEDGKIYRAGTEKDAERITGLFKSPEFAPYYEVENPYENLSYKAFNDCLADLHNKLKYRDYGSFFLFILSHGSKEGVESYFPDPKNRPEDHAIPIDEITAKFNDIPKLKGCPKVFVVQACQGQVDNKVQHDALAEGESQPHDINDSDDEEEEEEEGESLHAGPPQAADVLTAFATVKGYRSYRKGCGTGSWFIETLIKQIKKAHEHCYFSNHIIDILTEVQRKVSAKHAVNDTSYMYVKQMPCFQSSLRKKLYLLPPLLPYNQI